MRRLWPLCGRPRNAQRNGSFRGTPPEPEFWMHSGLRRSAKCCMGAPREFFLRPARRGGMVLCRDDTFAWAAICGPTCSISVHRCYRVPNFGGLPGTGGASPYIKEIRAPPPPPPRATKAPCTAISRISRCRPTNRCPRLLPRPAQPQPSTPQPSRTSIDGGPGPRSAAGNMPGSAALSAPPHGGHLH